MFSRILCYTHSLFTVNTGTPLSWVINTHIYSFTLSQWPTLFTMAHYSSRCCCEGGGMWQQEEHYSLTHCYIHTFHYPLSRHVTFASTAAGLFMLSTIHPPSARYHPMSLFSVHCNVNWTGSQALQIQCILFRLLDGSLLLLLSPSQGSFWYTQYSVDITALNTCLGGPLIIEGLWVFKWSIQAYHKGFLNTEE